MMLLNIPVDLIPFLLGKLETWVSSYKTFWGKEKLWVPNKNQKWAQISGLYKIDISDNNSDESTHEPLKSIFKL